MNELDEIPVSSFRHAIPIALMAADRFGNLSPYVPARASELHAIIQQQIRNIRGQLFFAQSAGQVTVLEKRMGILKEQEAKLLNPLKEWLTRKFLNGTEYCIGYLQGRKVVVPSVHFAGKLDWNNYSLEFGDHTYTDLQQVHVEELNAEQKIMIQRKAALNEDPPEPENPERSKGRPLSTGAPGRPSSMHLIEKEFERRAALGLTKPTITEEGKYLHDWMREVHSDCPPPSSKTIQNNLRAEFRRLQRLKMPDRA